jgi:hypothetical protein
VVFVLVIVVEDRYNLEIESGELIEMIERDLSGLITYIYVYECRRRKDSSFVR